MITINETQSLFVIPSGRGYSCLGFDVCERWTREMAAYCGEPVKPAMRGTLESYAEYQRISALAAAYSTRTGTRDTSEIIPELAPYIGKRIEVERDGRRERFKVGKSTGWRPILLEIKTRRSLGGSAAYWPKGSRVVRVIEGRI